MAVQEIKLQDLNTEAFIDEQVKAISEAGGDSRGKPGEYLRKEF